MDNIRDFSTRILSAMRDDRRFAERFEKDPAAAIGEVFDVELSEDKLKSVVKSVRAKLHSRDLGFGDIMDNEILPGKLPD